MSDYSQSIDFSDKDALSSGNASKVAKGADIDTELDLISTAITSKFDSDDIASQAQAEAESSNLVLITPLRLANWADENGGLVGEIQELADPNADRFLMWDDSAGAGSNVVLGTAGTGLGFSTTTIEMSHLGFEDLVDPNADRIAYWDDSAGKFDWLVVNAPLTVTGLNLDISAATTTADGVLEIATDAETNTGSATDKWITPANLAQATSLLQATATQKGAIEIADDTETNTGSATDRCITPANLAQATSLLQATATQKGATELAIQAEVDTGTDTARVITCKTLRDSRGSFVERGEVASDISYTSDTTFADVTGLTGFTVTAAKRYAGRLVLHGTQNGGDLKIQFVLSQTAGDAGFIRYNLVNTSSEISDDVHSNITTTVLVTQATDNIEFVTVLEFAFLAHATVNGTIKVQSAQTVSSANASTIIQGTYFEIFETGP